MSEKYFFIRQLAVGGWQEVVNRQRIVVSGWRSAVSRINFLKIPPTAYRLLPILTLLLTLTACSYDRGRNETSVSEVVDSLAGPPPEEATYQVFLENSGSMDGYVRGTTAFKDDIYQLLVDMGYISDRVMLFYINSQPIPYIRGTENFISNLEPGEFQQRGGNRSNSDLNQIFETLLRRTSDQRVILLISDFILSLEEGDTQDLLNRQRISVYNTFRQRLEDKPFATYLIKMYSDFSGNYYTLDDRPVSLKNVRRPYYLCFVGPPATIRALPKKLNVDQLPGFVRSYTLLPAVPPKVPFYTVLNNTYKQGQFRTDRAAAGPGYVHGIENAKASQRGQSSGTFGFSVAADLSGVDVDERYLLNPGNYEASGYRLDTVYTLSQVNTLHPRDRTMVEERATHVLAFSTTDNSYPDLQLALKKQVPDWVAQTHTDDDTQIKTDDSLHRQTFGFRYLVAGMEEAYRNVFGQDPYFVLKVSVNR